MSNLLRFFIPTGYRGGVSMAEGFIVMILFFVCLIILFTIQFISGQNKLFYMKVFLWLVIVYILVMYGYNNHAYLGI